MTINPENLGAKIAYTAAYAGLRVAQTLKIAGLREAMEARSINLLLAVLDENRNFLLKNIEDMEYILALCRDAGTLHYHTAELMFDELQKLKAINPANMVPDSKIAGLPDSIIVELTAQELFPKQIFKSKPEQETIRQIELKEPVISRAPAESSVQSSHSSRKSAIMDIIRQSGNCRLRELQDKLPNVSERTLRYDLQELVQEGILERIGQSGPATYYRLKEGFAG